MHRSVIYKKFRWSSKYYSSSRNILLIRTPTDTIDMKQYFVKIVSDFYIIPRTDPYTSYRKSTIISPSKKQCRIKTFLDITNKMMLFCDRAHLYMQNAQFYLIAALRMTGIRYDGLVVMFLAYSAIHTLWMARCKCVANLKNKSYVVPGCLLDRGTGIMTLAYSFHDDQRHNLSNAWDSS